MEFDRVDYDAPEVGSSRQRQFNIFPAIPSCKSASATIERSIQYMEVAGNQRIVTPLLSTRNWINRRVWLSGSNPVPKNLNKIFWGKLKRVVSKSEIEIISQHLQKIISAVYDIQNIVDKAEKTGSLPRYGDAVHRTLQTIHNLLFDWGYFQNKGQKFRTSSGTDLSFVWAQFTQEAMNGCDQFLLNVGQGFFSQDFLYFGNGLANNFLYVHRGQDAEILEQKFQRLYFGNRFTYFLPFGKDSAVTFVLPTHEYERILQGLMVDLIVYSDEVCKELIARRNEFLGDRFLEDDGRSLLDDSVSG